jgi:iron complex transport system permease protein
LAEGRARTLGPGLAAAAGLLLLAVLLSLSVGTQHVPFGTVVQAIVHPGGGFDDTVVQSRIPRTLLGLLCGAALSVAGVVVQGLTRNPLGDPGLLGVNVGAAATLVTAIAFKDDGSRADRANPAIRRGSTWPTSEASRPASEPTTQNR